MSEKKSVAEWFEYLCDLAGGAAEANCEWSEGFICGLANAGVLTDEEEDQLLNAIKNGHVEE